MSGRIEKAKTQIAELCHDKSIGAILEVLEIIEKYNSIDGKRLMEFAVDDLQADALRLTSLNFYLDTLAAALSGDATNAENVRRFQYSSTWVRLKKTEKNDKGAPVSDGVCDNMAEEAIAGYRLSEMDARKKADMMKAAVNSSQEVVNMLKKVVERLMMQGPGNNVL
jgi:hypothetical protein